MANFLKSLFVKGIEIDPAGATSAQVLSYNGTKFVPVTNSATATTDASLLTSGTLDNARLPAAATTITSVGTLGSLAVTNGVTAATFTGALTGTASGNLVSGGALGTPSSGTLTNCTFPTLNQNTTGTAATVTGAAQTAITSVGTLTSLTVGGAGANRSITINAPSSYYAIQYFQINGVYKWHYEAAPDGLSLAIVQSGVAARLTVTSSGTTISGTATATTFSGSGASLTSLPAGQLTGTIASARLSGSYTGITAIGTLSSLTVDGASSPAIAIGDWASGAGFASIVTSKGYLLLGATSGNDEVYLRSTTAGTAVRIGGNQADMLVVGGTTASFAGDVSNSGSYSTAGYFISTSGLAGSGQAAQWLAAFGQYYLMRVTSTRNDKENLQPLNDIVTPAMIDDIDITLWNRKGAEGFPEIGPMAEDMDDISPFLSTRGMDYDEDGNVIATEPNGINQNSWLSLLTIALQDSRKRIKELEDLLKQGENNG